MTQAPPELQENSWLDQPISRGGSDPLISKK